jgi:uncharacterized protein
MRKGDWIQTYSGNKFYPLDPRPEEILFADIAHALSNTCRFNGHCRQFYSVAQHSCLVAQQVSAENKLWGLLHDAAEAYIGDMVRPLKNLPEFSFFREMEDAILKAIAEKYNLPESIPDEVSCADIVVLRTEARDLGLFTPEWSISDVEPLPNRILPLDPMRAQIGFTQAFKSLVPKTRKEP